MNLSFHTSKQVNLQYFMMCVKKKQETTTTKKSTKKKPNKQKTVQTVQSSWNNKAQLSGHE